MTNHQLPVRGKKSFEELKLTNEYGAEYWSARDLQPLLGYTQWRRFEQAIDRAMTSCETSGNNPAHHFAGAGKMVGLGSGSQREVDDYQLSRFACYLIAQNGDPRKPEIAQAQKYFAVQARRQEQSEQAAADVERLELRKQTAEEFKALSGAAQDAGVQSKMFGVFHDAGYKGLYGGLGRDTIKQRKAIPEKDNLLDRMNATELAANQFRMTQTRDKFARARYQNPDDDPRGVWTSSDLTRREYREHDFYPIKLPSGREVLPARGRSWSVPKESFASLVKENRIYFGPNGDAMPRRKRFLTEIRGGLVPTTWWASDVAKNEDGRKELKELFPEEADVFATPKPEALIHRVITLATNDHDLVLDSFAGSGTTGAVAQKMGRRWIMVELGAHCHTHIIPRLKKVIDGEDPGGITKAVDWKGGGGFRYYRLAPSLLEKDKWGNWVINQNYNASMLAEALCKLEGFTYAPSDAVCWQHGHSTERDFIYITTANLSHEQLQQLNDEVAGYCPHPSPLPEGEGVKGATLLVLCAAFRGRGDYSNLTVKKIPKQVLSRCEWGHDDYSLQVENLPQAPAPQVALTLALAQGERGRNTGRGEKNNPSQQDLDLA